MSRRTAFSDSTLVRLLARLADADAPESRQGFADRLSQWLDWTDAISLSAALNGNPPTVPSGARPSGSDAEDGECGRIRAALAKAIADDGAFTAARGAQTSADFSPYRQRYLARQQAMEASIAPLRERLRARLAARSPAMARLAAVDAVMEQVLGAQEHRLLSTVPALLERHFKRLRQSEPAAPGDPQAPDAPGARTEGWLELFRKNMQELLLAELDLRWQPIEGLLEALRTRHTRLQ